MNTKRIAILVLFCALALVIGIIESLIPPILPFLPYVRIGLANIIIVFALLTLGAKEAFLISLIKAVFIGIFVGNPIMMLYSLPSSLLSLIVIIVLLKINKNSLCAISAIGAVVHNITQLAVAAFTTGTKLVFSYSPYFILAGAISGYAVGLLVILLADKLPLKSL